MEIKQRAEINTLRAILIVLAGGLPSRIEMCPGKFTIPPSADDSTRGSHWQLRDIFAAVSESHTSAQILRKLPVNSRLCRIMAFSYENTSRRISGQNSFNSLSIPSYRIRKQTWLAFSRSRGTRFAKRKKGLRAGRRGNWS